MTRLTRFLDWVLGPREETPAERLHRMTVERKNSFEVRDFARRRAAMLKVTRK